MLPLSPKMRALLAKLGDGQQHKLDSVGQVLVAYALGRRDLCETWGDSTGDYATITEAGGALLQNETV